MPLVDMRSDTITKPTQKMRQAMATAEVGDDVLGDDPTVKKLEEMAARMTGKEASLFVSSGTMANITCLLTHCNRGEEIILGDQSHIFFYEQGGTAALGGIHSRLITNRPDGKLPLEAVENSIRTDDVHFPRTKVIVLENTHNRCNGNPIDVNYMQAMGALARRHNLKIHVDGARIFNAAAALGTAVPELVSDADSVSLCLSKGLASPVGSLVCGTESFIAQARRNRKLLGGGTRQAGILAAAGIVSLTHMVERLGEDHTNARNLANGLVEINGISIDPSVVKTNIVYFDIEKSGLASTELVEKLNAEGVKMLPTATHQLRAVTNYHVTPGDIDYVIETMSKILG
jgi:threonine aldolase